MDSVAIGAHNTPGNDKPVHTLILDAGPLIKNHPAASTLLSHSQRLLTLPSIVSELLDSTTRSRFDTILRPFCEFRSPKPQSVKFVSDFARKTGDLSVLSKADLSVLALAYETECERNGGDWRLRSVPGQRGVNGKPPEMAAQEHTSETGGVLQEDAEEQEVAAGETEASAYSFQEHEEVASPGQRTEIERVQESLANSHFDDQGVGTEEKESREDASQDRESQQQEGSDSDGDWITPSNLRKRQAQDAAAAPESSLAAKQPKLMQVATLTTDFAMQNVLLQMNLNLLSPSLQRVRHLKTYILRCHACFEKVKDLSKQFCPRCGGHTLTRVACSTNENGEFKLHLKNNFQWNNRGNRYSIPKPVSSSASGKMNGKGGGKGAWGQGLILAEDQKEYVKAVGRLKHGKERDLMDEDSLPGIISGDRSRSAGGRPKVGAGRGVNSSRRR